MSRVVLFSLQVSAGASKGHLHPMLGVAERLADEGHDVAWMSVPHELPPGDRAQVLRTGARVLETPRSSHEPASAAELSRRTLVAEEAWELYRSFLVDPLDALVPPIVRALERERPDAVAADGLAYAAIIAARSASIPCATICAGLKLAGSSSLADAYRFDLRPLEEPRRRAFARFGLEARFHVLECLAGELEIVFATRDLLGDAVLPPSTLLAGPSRTRGRAGEPPFPWERLGDAPFVLMAFGSVHTHDPLLDVVVPFARAAIARGATPVIASEALARMARLGSALRELERTVVVPYAPQLALLRSASAFVTHGGASSVIESLDAGVAPIVVPLSGDQGIQARLVTARGAGLAIERTELDDRRAGSALERVMNPGDPLSIEARRIREAWSSADGALVAARAIAALARTSS